MSFYVVFVVYVLFSFFFFFNDTATTEIYTLSLHDALPISSPLLFCVHASVWNSRSFPSRTHRRFPVERSEEHTSELQSLTNLVCRLLLEKKNKTTNNRNHIKHRSRSPYRIGSRSQKIHINI